MIDNMNYNQGNKNGGYTLLFAILLTSVILAVSVSILSISRKEIILSTAGRDSLTSFYAADSAMECLLYWEGLGAISTSTSSTITCTTKSYTIDTDDWTQVGDLWTWSSGTGANDYILLGANSSGACAYISIEKGYEDVNGILQLQNKFTARGYNTCDRANDKRTERGIQVTF
jgi:hypothetical protein